MTTNDQLSAELARAVYPVLQRHQNAANIRNVTDPGVLYAMAADEQRARNQAAQPEPDELSESEIEHLTQQLSDPDDLYKLASYQDQLRRWKAGR